MGDDDLMLSDLHVPEPPRVRWYWSRSRKRAAELRYARRWMASMWEQTEGRPVFLGRFTND